MRVSAPQKSSAPRRGTRWLLPGLVLALAAWGILANFLSVGPALSADTAADSLPEPEELAHRLALAQAALAERGARVAALERLVAERDAEIERLREQQIAAAKAQAEARQQIEGLTMAVVVAEQEKKALRDAAEKARTESEPASP